MTSKIESWFVSQAGARIVDAAAGGHCQVNAVAAPGVPGGAPGTLITMAAGTYKTFDLAAAQLEAKLQAAFPAAGFSVLTGTDTIRISAVGWNFSLWWTDGEAQAYFGFASASYINQTTISSDTNPSGKITLEKPFDVEFWDEDISTQARRHDGTLAGTSLARLEGQKCRFFLISTEMAHFQLVLTRLNYGIPARIWIDSSASGAFDWTAADWVKGRDLAKYNAAAAVDLAQWTTPPWIGWRNLEIDFVEVT